MNDDIYLGQRESNRGCGCLIAAAVTLTILSIIFLMWWRSRAASPSQENPAPTPVESAPQDPGKAPSPSDLKIPAADQGENWLNQARTLYKQNKLAESRQFARKVLYQSENLRAIRGAEDILSDIHTTLVFSPLPMPEKIEYTVKSGDTLGGIAKKFGTTVELIGKSNQIQGSLIRVGQRLRVLQGTFFIEINKKTNELIVFLNDEFFKRYPVGTGEYGKTPVGSFKVNDRIAQPTWWRPDGKAIPFGHKDNLLGTHWLSLNIRGYGIHGTWDPDSIGKQSSAGCVRLLNKDIEELYNLIPLGTAVDIVEK